MSSIKISIITPSCRPGGLLLVAKALKRQTFSHKEIEWLVCMPQNMEKETKTTINDLFPYKFLGNSPLKRGMFWDLNFSYNRLIKNAKADLIVSWQDYTFADADALEKFWFHFTQEPKTLVSGVGNKYKDETWLEKVWSDPRERGDMGSYYQCYFADIEGNFSSVPKEAFYAVGGFDESLDFRGVGMDFYSVVDRLNILGGFDFKLNQTIKSYSLVHERMPNWDKDNLLNRYKEIHEQYLRNPVLDYLDLKDYNKPNTASNRIETQTI